MVLSLISTLASFSMKRPKTVLIIATTVALFAFAVHYNLLVGERDKLRVAEAGYKLAVTAFVEREAVMREDIRLAAEATAIVTAERNSQISALNTLRAGRQIDQDARVWGEQALPIGEIARLCEALPEMVGCQSGPKGNNHE